MNDPKALGRSGEEQAKLYLQKKGFKIMAKNYRSPFGEVDLICEEKNDLVFVEVKTRHSLEYGDGSEAVDFSKKEKLLKSALYYLKAHDLESRNFRFDVVSILVGRVEKITHIVHAFP